MKSNTTNNTNSGDRTPVIPQASKSTAEDIRNYFYNKPPVKTLVEFSNKEERKEYSQRISARIGIDVERYKVLNIHQIGIDAPPNFVFNEILKWNGSSCWWPNHIARVNLQNGKLEDIRVTLLGKSKYAFGIKKGIFGFDYLHLFNLNALVFQHTPKPEETDNARYLLYKCSGGYPIGVCAIFVRSSFPEREEERHVSQLFFMVGFNFYGKPSWSNFNPVRLTWEGIHNRVTGNVVNRIKQLCEGIYTNGENSQ